MQLSRVYTNPDKNNKSDCDDDDDDNHDEGCDGDVHTF